MKKTITLFTILLSVIAVQAQESIDLLTYENTQDINFFTSVKNGALIKEYITTNKNSVKIGDTLILGSPTSQEMNTRTYSGSYGNRATGGVAQSRSTSKKHMNLYNWEDQLDLEVLCQLWVVMHRIWQITV